MRAVEKRSLTDKLKDELKIVGVSLVPFSIIFSYGKGKNPLFCDVVEKIRSPAKRIKNDGEFFGIMRIRDKLLYGFNSLITACSCIVVAGSLFYYSTNTINYGFDYSQWELKRDSLYKKEELQKQIQQQDIYRNQFLELDKNKNGVLDSLEFIYR